MLCFGFTSLHSLSLLQLKTFSWKEKLFSLLIYSELKKKKLFLYLFWLCCVFVATRWHCLVLGSRGYCGFGALASCFGGFSCCRARALGYTDFRSCGSQALEYKLNICGSQAQLLHGIWDLLRPGIEPVSLHWQTDSITEPVEEPDL